MKRWCHLLLHLWPVTFDNHDADNASFRLSAFLQGGLQSSQEAQLDGTTPHMQNMQQNLVDRLASARDELLGGGGGGKV